MTIPKTAPEVECWAYAGNLAKIPALQGLDKTNTALFLAKPCAPASGSMCTACVENYLSCDTCAVNDYRQTVGLISNCFSTGSFPTGYGPHTTAVPKVLMPCTASKNCEKCETDYLSCSLCSTSTAYTIMKYIDVAGTLTKDECLQASTAVAGWGADAAVPNSIRPCVATHNCVTCGTDYQKCLTCAANSYLLDIGGGNIKCVTQAQIPDGKGAELDAAVGTQARALDCQITSCAKCSANYKTTCTECTGVLYLSALGPDVLLPRCVDTAGIPTGYRGTTNRLTEECTTDDCAACPAAAATCTQCKTTFYLHSPDGECYSADEPIVGYRFDTSGVTQACTPNCKVCTAASNTCEMCADTYYLTGGLCYTASLIPDGVGFNNGNQGVQLLVACSVGSCQKCANNHNQCALCSGSNLVHFDGSAWSCVSSLPSGYGNDPASNPPVKTIACQASNCDTCSTDYTICTACKAGTSTYLYDTASTCLTKAQFPTGFGLNTATNKVAACSTSNCETCPDTIATCTKCQNSKGFYMKGTNSCIQKANFVNGEGLNPTTLKVEACSSTGCRDCVDDNGVCKSCDTATSYYLLKSACLAKTAITAGQGINAASGTVESCTSRGCTNCTDDFSKCVRCNQTSGYQLTGTSCTQESSTPVVEPAKVRIKLSSGSVNIPLGPDQSRVIDKIIVTDLLEGKQYTGDELGCKTEITDEGFKFTFVTQTKITKGRLRIERRESRRMLSNMNQRILLDASPITIDGFVLVKSSWFTSLNVGFQVIISMLRLPFSVVMFMKYPWTAMIFDRLVTQMTILSLFQGPTLVYPKTMLQMMSELKVLPFRFTNPFESWNSNTLSCTPPDEYASVGLYCSFLDNYGQNVITLFGILLLVLTVHFVIKCMLRNKQLSEEKKKELEKFQLYYGPMFLIAKLDANHLEVVLFSLVSWAVSSGESKAVIGILLAVFAFMGYVGLAFIKTKILQQEVKKRLGSSVGPKGLFANKKSDSELFKAATLRKPASSRNEATPSMGQQDLLTLSESFNVHPRKMLRYSFDLCRCPGALPSVLIEAVKYLRALLLCILVLNQLKTAWVQSLLAVLLESAYLAYLVKYEIKYFSFERYTQIALQGLTIFYLILKAISTSDGLSDTGRYVALSNIMAVVLTFMVIIPIILAMICLLGLIYSYMPGTPEPKPEHETVGTSEKPEMAGTEKSNFQATEKVDLVSEPKFERLPSLKAPPKQKSNRVAPSHTPKLPPIESFQGQQLTEANLLSRDDNRLVTETFVPTLYTEASEIPHSPKLRPETRLDLGIIKEDSNRAAEDEADNKA